MTYTSLSCGREVSLFYKKHTSRLYARNKIRRYTFVAKVELKQPIVTEISEAINGAASVVVVDYRGLTVAQDTELRKKL